MLPRITLVAILLLSASFGVAQSVTPTVTYGLQAERPPKSNSWALRLTAVAPQPVLAVTPDKHTVLALIPQQNPHWKLSAITRWETGKPQERSLSFDGYVQTNREEHISGRMNPVPDGKSVLVRIMVYHLGTFTRRAVVLMIDLEKMQVIWRQDSDDPLLANSRWQFSQRGALIAAEGPPPDSDKRNNIYTDTFTINPSSVGEHDAASLSLPDLKPSLPCRYRVSVGPYADAAKIAELETSTCSDLLDAAAVKSAVRLPGSPVSEQIEHQAGSLCTFVAVSNQTAFALYNCRTGHPMSDGRFYTTGRAATVIVPATGKEMLSIPQPEYGHVVTALASAGGHDYLIRLRDGTDFEAYLLP